MYRTRIYYKDTDAGGVVYYANYLRFFEAARTEFLRDHGVDLNTWVQQGILFVVIRAEVDYLIPARYGDDLQVETQCLAVSGARFDLANRVLREKDGKTLAKGMTRMACIKENGRPARIPGKIHEILTTSKNRSGEQHGSAL